MQYSIKYNRDKYAKYSYSYIGHVHKVMWYLLIPKQCITPSYSPDRLVPHNREISHTCKILCDSYGVVQVENNMPPPTWDEDSLPGLLEDLQLRYLQEHRIDK